MGAGENATDTTEVRPDYKNYRIFCDDSGLHGAKFYGFGALWMPTERRGDFHRDIERLRKEHRYGDEIKWNHIKPKNQALYEALVDYFFRTRSLMFHCLFVRKALVDKSLHGEDPMDLAGC